MKIKLLTGLIVISLILISGCAQIQTNQQIKEPLCKSPYIEYKSGECCLDSNNNGICEQTNDGKQAECLKDSECYGTPKDYCSLDKCDSITQKCTHKPITDCAINDKCCPSTCYYPADPDCPTTKIKSQTDVSSEVNLICSSGLSNLKIIGAKLVGTNIEVTIDNANEQKISGFFFRIFTSDGSIIPMDSSALTYVAPATESLTAFSVQKYTIRIGADWPTIITGTTTIGAMPKIEASDGSIHICPIEIKITII